MDENPYRSHVIAAARRLGVLHRQAEDAVAALLLANEGMHPHAIARLYRQSGTQLDAATKKAAGILSNADMTIEAWQALTDTGRSAPLRALNSVFLSASFGRLRERNVQQARSAGYDSFKVDAVAPECAGCRRLHGMKVSGDYLDQLPPADCARDGCMAMLVLYIDFLAGIR